MIYHVSGELIKREPYMAVVDCGGVGYKMTISLNTSDEIAAKVGENVRLYTHMQVREDGVELFGFASEDELDSFKMLITVSGVGPKAAIAILSILTPERLALAISTEDTKAIAKASGVGAKTAARVILELRDKISKVTVIPKSAQSTGKTVSSPASSSKLSEATDALTVLGYNRNEITGALAGIDISEMTLEKIITAALKRLS